MSGAKVKNNHGFRVEEFFQIVIAKTVSFSQIVSMKLNFYRYIGCLHFFCKVSVSERTHRHPFGPTGSRIRVKNAEKVSLSMTLRFSDLLPVQEVENVLPSDAEIWPIVLGLW